MLETNDISIVYYTANTIPDKFAIETRRQLKKAAKDIPIITVSLNKDLKFGVGGFTYTGKPSHINIYKQALMGAKLAQTKYIALCEDDVLYSPEHFKHRPSPNTFAYNLGAWSIFTWGEPMFTHKGIVRKNLNSLICERDLFIGAMEERFRKYPDESKVDTDIWAEPGRYEKQLGVTEHQTEEFYTNPPNIVFSHENELSFKGLGIRKRVGEYRAYSIPYWGTAEKVRDLYGSPDKDKCIKCNSPPAKGIIYCLDCFEKAGY